MIKKTLKGFGWLAIGAVWILYTPFVKVYQGLMWPIRKVGKAIGRALRKH